MSDLLKRLLQIAAENPKGFTVTIPDCEPVTKGWCIGHGETQNSHGVKGLKRVIEHAAQTTGVVGGWKGYKGKYYFDTVIITYDPMEALDLKVEHGQHAIYNLETGKIC